MNCYPATVRPHVTIIDDKALIEVVRAGCGDDVAEVLEERLKNALAGKQAKEALEEAISELRHAIMFAENAESELGNLLSMEE